MILKRQKASDTMNVLTSIKEDKSVIPMHVGSVHRDAYDLRSLPVDPAFSHDLVVVPESKPEVEVGFRQLTYLTRFTYVTRVLCSQRAPR